MMVSVWSKLRCLSEGKKSTSSFMFSLRYCKGIANSLFWILWACLAKHIQSGTIDLQKTFLSICRQNINSTPHIFFWDIANICKFLFWELWPYQATNTQQDTINLQKTSMFIRMPKINNHSLFLRYPILKKTTFWLANSILQEPEFCKI